MGNESYSKDGERRLLEMVRDFAESIAGLEISAEEARTWVAQGVIADVSPNLKGAFEKIKKEEAEK